MITRNEIVEKLDKTIAYSPKCDCKNYRNCLCHGKIVKVDDLIYQFESMHKNILDKFSGGATVNYDHGAIAMLVTITDYIKGLA